MRGGAGIEPAVWGSSKLAALERICQLCGESAAAATKSKSDSCLSLWPTICSGRGPNQMDEVAPTVSEGDTLTSL